MATFKVITLPGDLHRKAAGTKNIKIRIYHNKAIQYISTAYYIEETLLVDMLLLLGQIKRLKLVNQQIDNHYVQIGKVQ